MVRITEAIRQVLRLSAIASLTMTAAFSMPAVTHAMEGSSPASDAGAGQCPEGSDYGSLVKAAEGGADAYQATNPGSTATGAYQFLYGTLADLGYIDKSASSTPSAGAGEWTNVVWTGKGGVNSREEFMSNMGAQDQAMAEFTQKNLDAIKGSFTEGQIVNGIPMTSGGAAFAAHMLGTGGFNKWAASGFTAAGLDPSIAAAHGWTAEEYNNHLMGRVAKGGCFDPGDIAVSEGSVTELPQIYLMEWVPLHRVPTVRPGQVTVVGPI